MTFLYKCTNFGIKSAATLAMTLAAGGGCGSPGNGGSQPFPYEETHYSVVNDASFSRDGKKIVTVGTTVKIWDAGSGKLTKVLKDRVNGSLSADFSPDGNQVLIASTGYFSPNADPADIAPLSLWDINSGTVIKRFEQVVGDLQVCAHFSPDGSKVLSTAANHSPSIWDATTGKYVTTLGTGSGAWCADFSPDSKKVVIGKEDHANFVVSLVDAASGKEIEPIASVNSTLSPQSTRFSHDGTKIVVVAKVATIWDVVSHKLLLTLTYAGGGINFADLSSDGTRLVTAHSDGTAGIWDLTTGKLKITLTGHKDSVNVARFSPDGKQVITGSQDATARIWDLSNPETVTSRILIDPSIPDDEF